MSRDPSRAEYPVLQAALDFVETDRALALAREAVAGGAAWIEAGTPLIKSEGLACVRALREAFPENVLVADMKTMDAGRAEVEAAARAGADIAVVLGVASEATIRQCIEGGQNYGCKVYVDLLGTADPAARAREVEAWGADFVGVHLPIDEQMRGGDTLSLLRQVAGAVDLPVAAAGGITSETAPALVEAGASILIVGGALTKAGDARAAAGAIRTAVEQKRAVASALSRRANADTLRETLARVSSSNLSDALQRGGVLEGIRCLTPGRSLAGPAFTVRSAPGDWAKPVEAIDAAAPGDVLVIDCGGAGPAVWGGCATESAAGRGLAGVVIDGYARDIDEILATELPVFARGVVPNAGEPRGLGELQTPVTVGGRRVSPGDWLRGDGSGVVSVEAARAVEYANRAQDVAETEARLHEEIARGSTLGKVLHLEKWERR